MQTFLSNPVSLPKIVQLIIKGRNDYYLSDTGNKFVKINDTLHLVTSEAQGKG